MCPDLNGTKPGIMHNVNFPNNMTRVSRHIQCMKIKVQHIVKLQESLFARVTTYEVQMLQNISYKVCSILLPKFTTFRLSILILDISIIVDKAACC